MATRCTIHIKEDGKILTSIYVHSDGYPKGIGLDTARALLSMPWHPSMGSKAAHLVTRLTDDELPGNVQVFLPGQENWDLRFVYTLFIGSKSRKLKLRCKTAYGNHVYLGTPEQWVKKYGDDTQTNNLPVMGAGTILSSVSYFDSIC